MRHYKPTMIRYTLTYCFTLLTSLTIAQSLDSFNISGTIVSTNNGTPISYATIMLTRTKGTISDSLGYFTVNGLKKGQYKLSLSSLGYNSKDTTITITDHDINNLVLAIYSDCNSFPEVNKEMALKDIIKGKPKLLLAGGIAPVIYETDKTFQIKYGVSFFDYGCVSPSQECMLAYNKTVFEYLDKTYGKDWRKEIRKDIIGLKDK